MTITSETMKKILLFKIGAIGDTIMTTPLVRQLRKRFADARLDYLIGRTASQALLGNKHLDEIITFEESVFFKKNIFQWMALVRKVRETHYDTVFVLDKHRFCSLTASFFNIKERIGFDRLGKEGVGLTHKVYFDGSRHEILYYLDLLKAYTGKADYRDVKTELFLAKKDISFAADVWKKHRIRKKKVVVIAPGGAQNPGQSVSLKLWPKERYTELTKRLVAKNSAVVLVGDKNDTALSSFIAEKVKSPLCIDLTGKTTIRQTAALMKNASCIVCNDTGSMHIASAVNERIISIFGPTDPKRFAPLHKKSICLCRNEGKPCNDIFGNFRDCTEKNDCGLISVDEVALAAERKA